MTYNEFLKLNSTSACGRTVRFKTEYVQLNNLVVVSLRYVEALTSGFKTFAFCGGKCKIDR